MTHLLQGLIAATHTPFNSAGDLELQAIEKQAAHLVANNISFAFIGGTTGECHSLTLDERRALTQRWMEVVRGSKLKVVVHVGSNCLRDGASLTSHASSLGAAAIASCSPSYFKPPTLKALIDSMAMLAGAAPELPFYFYDIPSMTNVHFPMSDFLTKGQEAIPNLAGMKFTNSDLMTYLALQQLDGGKWDIPFGYDELLLAALAYGARGAVGSTYNFAAPIYHRLIAAYEQGDLSSARAEQARSVQLIQTLVKFGYVGACKTLMGWIGVPIGQPRLPCVPLVDSNGFRAELERIGYWDWGVLSGTIPQYS